MRQGPRSQPTALTRAVVAILNETMIREDISRHRLAKMIEGRVSRSQLYDVLAVKRTLDLAELDAICEALGLRMGEVVAEAQDAAPPETSSTDAG
jgi:DNA-binding Xre family transcriptional regulator